MVDISLVSLEMTSRVSEDKKLISSIAVSFRSCTSMSLKRMSLSTRSIFQQTSISAWRTNQLFLVCHMALSSFISNVRKNEGINL